MDNGHQSHTSYHKQHSYFYIIFIFRNISSQCHRDVRWDPQGSLLPCWDFELHTTPKFLVSLFFLHQQSHSLISFNYICIISLWSCPWMLTHPLGLGGRGDSLQNSQEMAQSQKISLSEKVKVYSQPLLRQKKSEIGNSTNFFWQLLGLLSDSFSKAVKQESAHCSLPLPVSRFASRLN